MKTQSLFLRWLARIFTWLVVGIVVLITAVADVLTALQTGLPLAP